MSTPAQHNDPLIDDPIGLWTRLKLLFPANRIVALVGVIGAIVAFLVTIQSSLVPGSPGAEAIAKAIVLLGTIGTFLATILKFLHGSQQYDKLLLGGGNESNVKGENVTVVNTTEVPEPVDAETIAAKIAFEKAAAGTRVVELVDHPDNPAAPNHEITEEDVEAEFGTTEPLDADQIDIAQPDAAQPDDVNPEATAQRLADEQNGG